MTRFPLRFLLFAAGLLAVLALGEAATAQKQPAIPVAPPAKQPADPDEVKTKKAPGRVLTSDSLSELLDSMGYDFRTNAMPSGSAIYTLTIPSDTWTFVVEVSLAPNGSLVWLNAPLQPLPADGAIPDERLIRLLQENWAIYPHAFAIPKDSRRLYIQRATENQNMTPAKLRGAIDAMTSTVRTTAPLWDVSKWGQTPTPEPKKGTDGAAAYPDTPEGLTKFCQEMLTLAKAGKRAEVIGHVKGLIVYGYDAWFKRTFGPELGAAMSEEYSSGLAQLQESATRSFMTAAEEGLSEVKVFKFTKPDPENANATQNKALEAMAVKTPLYSVYFTQPGEHTGMHLYSFVYVGGRFYLAGKMKAATVRTSGFRGLNGFEFLTPLAPTASTPRVASPPAGLVGLAQDEADRAGSGLRPAVVAADVTGTWVNYGGVEPGAPRMTMRLSRNGTYSITATAGNDSGRYSITAGVIFAQSNTGLRSRIYVSWMGSDLASFGFKPDDDTSTPVWLTFTRLRELNAADPAVGVRPEVNPIIPAFGMVPGFSAPVAPAPAANRLDPDAFRHLTPLIPAQMPNLVPLGNSLNGFNRDSGASWGRRPDSAACPNPHCTGGWCYKFPGHGGAHQCGTCGWSWY
ncbi:MAG: hypothetical protein K8U57_06935 [Planctomycetes bacterium]|nr:hypothetical protein [Planctomycetota bacterium]